MKRLNNISGYILVAFIYFISIIISLVTNVSIEVVMKNYQFDVLIILIFMEFFTNLISSTGIMEFLSLKIAKKSLGNKKRIIVLFGLLMFFISAFLNNITAVLMILPIVFVMLKTIGINQKYLNIFFASLLALSNTGGAASPIGDFPAIVIMSSGITTFLNYLLRAFPFFFITSLLILIRWKIVVESNDKTIEQNKLSLDILTSKYKNLVVKKDVLIYLIIIFIFMFIGWSFVPRRIIPPEIIAVIGYVLASVVCAFKKVKIVQTIDFKPILLISGFLFLAGIISETGFLTDVATILQNNIINPKILLIVIMFITSIMSGLFGAGPAASAMMPVVVNLCNTIFINQSSWVAVAYAASICAGSSLFMWSATAGFVLSKKINDENLFDENKNILKWNISNYLKYGIQNYIIQIIFAIIVMYFII